MNFGFIDSLIEKAQQKVRYKQYLNQGMEETKANVSKMLSAPRQQPKVRFANMGEISQQLTGLTPQENTSFSQQLSSGGYSSVNPELRNKQLDATQNLALGFTQAPAYKEATRLTTSVLKQLEGRSSVSKQFIQDLTNRPELKQVERDLIRGKLGNYGDQIPVAKFASEVKNELLPLKRMSIGKTTDSMNGVGGTRYENIALPDELRGNIKNYDENIYRSPIKTSAGQTHFGDADTGDYFGHTRIEDMADDQTRRVIEVQSDLYQKGRLEQDSAIARLNLESAAQRSTPNDMVVFDNYKQRADELAKLQQYNDPTAHFRMVREEVATAAKDGKKYLQFPTGETAMKIEGLGETAQWGARLPDGIGGTNFLNIEPSDLKPGLEVMQGTNIGVRPDDSKWIITDVLGDGKFKAVPKNNISENSARLLREGKDRFDIPSTDSLTISNYAESFDISGKVDTSNPIYKFYEKDLGRYLRSKYKTNTVTDSSGVKWNQIDLNPSHKLPVEAFGVGALTLGGFSKFLSDDRKQK